MSDAFEIPKRIAAARRAAFDNPNSAEAIADALGAIEVMLGSMYARDGVPITHRDMLRNFERRASEKEGI